MNTISEQIKKSKELTDLVLASPKKKIKEADLSAIPDVISQLAYGKKGDEAIAFIVAQTPEMQGKILCGYRVVEALAQNGLSPEVLDIISNLPIKIQSDIFLSYNTGDSLKHNGYVEEVDALVAALPEAVRNQISLNRAADYSWLATGEGSRTARSFEIKPKPEKGPTLP